MGACFKLARRAAGGARATKPASPVCRRARGGFVTRGRARARRGLTRAAGGVSRPLDRLRVDSESTPSRVRWGGRRALVGGGAGQERAAAAALKLPRDEKWGSGSGHVMRAQPADSRDLVGKMGGARVVEKGAAWPSALYGTSCRCR